MPGMREAALLGAALGLGGGLAYWVWSRSVGDLEARTGTEPRTEPETNTANSGLLSGGVREGPPRRETEAPRSLHTDCRPVRRGCRVLVLGLDGSGKSSLLQCFSCGVLEQEVTPTDGFNAVSISSEDLHVEFLEIGGKEALRPYWQKYLPQALVLVFVVDSSRRDLFPTARKLLQDLLTFDPRLPLVVLANKQDLSGACSITELHDALSLSLLGNQRKLFLISTFVRRGAELSAGVQDARELLLQMVADAR